LLDLDLDLAARVLERLAYERDLAIFPLLQRELAKGRLV
jgi:hypothetical protein